MSAGVPRDDLRSPRKWVCIDTGERDGKFNMDFDLGLVDRFKRTRTPVLRFYRWKPYCISIGRNQNYSDINVALAEQNGIEITRRPTGGKAVLHAEELTYSVVMDSAGLALRESYDLISKALVGGLRTLGADLDLSKSSADFRKLFHDPSTIPCFSTSAVYEVEHRGRKVIGSAQHRFGEVLLQHGSILTGDYHKEIVRYLNIDDDLKRKTADDLDGHTATLTEILGKPVDVEAVKRGVTLGFEEIFGADFSPVAGGDVEEGLSFPYHTERVAIGQSLNTGG